MRQKICTGIVVALVIAIGLALFARGCKSCAGRLSHAARVTAGWPGILSLLPTSGPTEPQKPNIVPPGYSVLPRTTRRPMFGTTRTEGEEITAKDAKNAKGDSVKIFVGKDGTVVNLGGETLSIRVTRIGPAWVEWDLSLGLCAFVSSDREDWKPVARQGGYCLDVGGKLKLMDFRPLYGLQIGIPALYATTGCLGVGGDVKITGAEWIALDVAWFPVVKRAAVGVSLNLP